MPPLCPICEQYHLVIEGRVSDYCPVDVTFELLVTERVTTRVVVDANSLEKAESKAIALVRAERGEAVEDHLDGIVSVRLVR